MLPAILLTLAYFLVNVGSSPVYNMQPAYITANIGTTGRNIRNLPCISRKNSLSGVCMFAIDCFKANGTHLGTCIDRFYFGSCCHIEPVSNEIDNSIEPALYPDKHREPPLRLGTTEKVDGETVINTSINPEKIISTSTSSSTSTSISTTTPTTVFIASTVKGFDKQPTSSSSSGTTTTTTTTTKASRETTTTPGTTQKPVRITTTRKPLTTILTTIPTTTTIPTSTTTRSTTTRTTRTTTTPTTTTKIEITSRTPIILTKEPTTEFNEAYRLTTFQSVDNEIQTTLKPFVSFSKPSSISSSIYKTTRKPIPQVSVISEDTREPVTISVPLVTRPPASLKPEGSKITTKPTVKPITAQKPSKPSSRPTKPTGLKPSVKPTRVKPNRTTQKPPLVRPTNKPIQSKPTRRTTTTTKPTKPTRPLIKISTTTVAGVSTERLSTTKVDQLNETKTTASFVLTPSTESPLKTTTADKLEIPSSHSSITHISSEISSSTTEISSSTTQLSSSTTQLSSSTTQLSSSTTQIPSSTPSSSSSLSSSTSSTTSTTTPPSTTTKQSPIVLTTESPVALFPMEEDMKVPEMATTTESNDILNMNLTSIFSEGVNGNTATNEIESAKPLVEPTTTRPGLVTWTGAFEEPIVNATDGDWVPITTPDGWVMLPSVSSTDGQSSTPSTSSSTSEKPSIQGSPSSSTDPTSTTIRQEVSPSDFFNVSSSSTVYEENPTTVESNVDILEEPAFNMSDYRDVCGRRIYPEARIVGGDNSSFGKWPWQISLRQWRTSTYLHKCGAALLSEYWAITAAHCVERVPPSDLLLRLGEYDLANELEPYVHQERRVQIVASHPQFDPRTFEYDLALLRFYEPVKFQPNILPVCVPQTDDDFIGTNAFVTGWGRLYEDGPLPNILQEVRVPVINNTLCESMYRSAGYIEHIPHIFICAGWGRGGYDSCEGDSGGPMVIQREDKRFLLAGVISWGIGCAEPNQPGVYTRISEFRDWINQILQF